MRIRTGPEHVTWTPLSIRMGFTSSLEQRAQILLAIRSMTWTNAGHQLPDLHGAAARTIVAAVLHSRRDLVEFVGVAHLDGGRQLIGLQDTRGACRYVLDLDAEAIHVLVVPADSALVSVRVA